MLISEEYRALNAQMHRVNDSFGRESHKYAPRILAMARALGTTDILDYGAGKATLHGALAGTDLRVRCYDPAIPEFAQPPEPADIVVCTDVLEHIEPGCLADVLADLRRLAGIGLYLIITTKPAVKALPDGTNPHRIVEPAQWWHARLEEAGIEILKMTAVRPRKRYEFLARCHDGH